MHAFRVAYREDGEEEWHTALFETIEAVKWFEWAYNGETEQRGIVEVEEA